MAFPANLTNAIDGVTDVIAAHLNDLEEKVGIDGSLVTTSLDYLLKNPASIEPGHQHTRASISGLLASDVGLGNVTNDAQVKLSGSYSDPTWLTGLNASKLLAGTGAVALTAGGMNQNVVLTPSGSGYTILNGNTGIGTTIPATQLDVFSNSISTNRGITCTQVYPHSAAALVSFKKARGAVGSLGTAINGDYIGSCQFAIYDGSNFLSTAGFGALVNGTVASGSIPTDLFFWTSGGPNDSNPYTNNHVRLVIASGGNIGVGLTSPNTAALLHLSSTTKGFLPPVMTTAQKTAIASPPAGLVVYDSTLNKLCVYTGSAWETITSV